MFLSRSLKEILSSIQLVSFLLNCAILIESSQISIPAISSPATFALLIFSENILLKFDKVFFLFLFSELSLLSFFKLNLSFKVDKFFKDDKSKLNSFFFFSSFITGVTTSLT